MIDLFNSSLNTSSCSMFGPLSSLYVVNLWKSYAAHAVWFFYWVWHWSLPFMKTETAIFFHPGSPRTSTFSYYLKSSFVDRLFLLRSSFALPRRLLRTDFLPDLYFNRRQIFSSNICIGSELSCNWHVIDLLKSGWQVYVLSDVFASSFVLFAQLFEIVNCGNFLWFFVCL